MILDKSGGYSLKVCPTCKGKGGGDKFARWTNYQGWCHPCKGTGMVKIFPKVEVKTPSK